MGNDRLDLVIFGATGFTGKYTLKQAVKFCQEKQLTFGISGRRKEALQTVLEKFAPGSENVPIIIADLKDEASLKKMTEQAKVLINCCGPYTLYGEPVIKACIETTTHYVDVTGEPQFMEKMQLEYNKAAQEAGVYIISACGFDSIPCDLGIIFTQDKFQGEVNSIESYVTSWTTAPLRGPAIHPGTWESAVEIIGDLDEIRQLRLKLFSTKLPKFSPVLKRRGLLHKNSVSEGWSTRFLGPDRSVAYRTQRFLYDKYKQRPVQVETYMTLRSLLVMLQFGIVGLAMVLLGRFECGRRLLIKHPKFFTFGFVSHEGPDEQSMEHVHFSTTFEAKGWTTKSANVTDKRLEPPNKEMVTKVSGRNPVYGITCIALVLSAVTIVKEFDKMPDRGGVLPPGAAFAKTSLIDELNKNGLKFEVLSTKEK